MIYVRLPPDEGHHELKRKARQEIGLVAQRAQMILLWAQGRGVPEITLLFESNRKTVRYWMGQFDERRTAGLYDAPRSGRPHKLTARVTSATYAPQRGARPRRRWLQWLRQGGGAAGEASRTRGQL